jgi:hypothetical protein
VRSENRGVAHELALNPHRFRVKSLLVQTAT